MHFSQFERNSLMLNPAFTGYIEGSYRFHLHFRNQWYNLADNGVYNTPSASFDLNIGMKESHSSYGIGLVVAKDYSGSGAFEHLVGLLSLSYHLGLDAFEKYFLSIGVQGGVYQKKLDFTKLTFESQFNGFEIDPGIGAMENFQREEVIQPNFRAGVTWSSYFSEKMRVIVGAAYMNMLEADETFLERNNLPSRLVVHLDVGISVVSRVDLSFLLLYMKQSGVQQTNAGVVLEYNFPRDYSFSIGGGIRNKDAAIGRFGLGFKGFDIHFSYDMTTSDLNAFNDGIGAFELSLTYTGNFKKAEKPIMPAIRFF